MATNLIMKIAMFVSSTHNRRFIHIFFFIIYFICFGCDLFIIAIRERANRIQ